MDNIYMCPYCNKEYNSKNAWCSHKGKCRLNPDYVEKLKKPRSDKGKHLSEEHRDKIKKGVQRAISEGKKYDGFSWRGKKHTEEEKKKISKGMKKAHFEGRAHNIGECRWNNEPSYPERWLMRVLKNEFNLEKDKDYKMEYPFYRFSLDFAWPEEKLCIEIDGEQHERFQEQKDRDLEKDKLLKKEGWKELRKPWRVIFNNPKAFIEEVKILLDRC